MWVIMILVGLCALIATSRLVGFCLLYCGIVAVRSVRRLTWPATLGIVRNVAVSITAYLAAMLAVNAALAAVLLTVAGAVKLILIML